MIAIYLIIISYYGGIERVPMMNMEQCEAARVVIDESRNRYADPNTYCIAGKMQ